MTDLITIVTLITGLLSGVVSGIVSSAVQHAVSRTEIKSLWREVDRHEGELDKFRAVLYGRQR